MMRSLQLIAGLATLVQATCGQKCRCLPEDPCWPKEIQWSDLNRTVDGVLVETVPIGSPCHEPHYDEAACVALQQDWHNPLIHIPSSSSAMQSYFANQSCDPFTDKSVPCQLGNYVSYAVKAKKPSHIAEALRFAHKNNIRPVIRNTGHDFLGRSTGAGGLGIWTQDLKSIEFIDWQDGQYTGKAVRVGAGVVGYEMLEAAHAQGLTVVSGECATVGLAGGFTQGGGHSTLSTQFGLGADQTLEFEVVVANGDKVKATPTKNSDLYWALSGGGGGTFGVVTSMVVKAYESANVGGAGFQLLAATTTPEKFAAIVTKFYEELPGMIDNGAMVVFLNNAQFLALKPLTAWNQTADYVRDVILKPFTDFVAEQGVQLPIAYSGMSYRDHYARYLGPLPRGAFEVQRYQFGGRLIPRDVVENNLEDLEAVLTNLKSNGVLLAGSAASYAKPAGTPANSVHPAWRQTLIQMQLITNWDSSAPWETMEADQKRITDEFMPLIESVTPGSAAYMNEADFRQPRWQQEFYGSNYDALLEVKEKWDPNSMFYVLKGVGSENWNVANNGKMCKA